MLCLALQPAHVVSAMGRRAGRIASERGNDATRYHRLACLCREELLRRRLAESRGIAAVSVPVPDCEGDWQ